MLVSYGRAGIARYQFLLGLKELFAVYLPDHLAQFIQSFFAQHTELTSGMRNSIQKALEDPHRQSQITQQLGIHLPSCMDSAATANVIAQIICKQSATYRDFQKKIQQELKKYVNKQGVEIKASK